MLISSICITLCYSVCTGFNAMPFRDPSMKRVGFWVTGDFRKRLAKEAKRRGVSVSDLIRNMLKDEMGESDDIGSQKKKPSK